ncbi:hypothetical protein BEL04_08735 [Mucilaginibacter sp. PPCGB 2223]|uniref:hypothetical protein n=1 Tax=Mucilaginibacter sp. PPCGB 2223 TaxID=1886027 RepID=UPI000824D6A6|nr:hypothetical protein [Mucilaginibacter sp. PPCGB 2223]OCX54334.1 hypothetical protein BEL04_08735 [Mucilaginibacter sp. PPCGB 2223]
MKKLIIPILLLMACNTNHDGRYTNHTQGQFSITDDTLEVRDTLIIEHTGFQRIRNGVTRPKEYKTKQLFELHPQFNGNQLILNNTTYEKL